MSHAVRNTLILLIVLLLFVAASWGYIHYYQIPEKKQLKEQVDKKKRELKADQEIANQYAALSETYQEASAYFNNYEKALYLNSNEDNVYDFLNGLNSGSSYINFNFAFTDSTLSPKYGVINMKISGDGRYRNLVNFIHKLELSKPLNKVKNISVNPIKEEDEYNKVSYNFTLLSYYDRSRVLGEPSFEIHEVGYASVHNPFLPLVRDIKPNKAGRVDVDKSELVALSTSKAFLLDQNGIMQQLGVGDEVYLGKLTSINLKARTATFTLNKGGIVKKQTLEVKK